MQRNDEVRPPSGAHASEGELHTFLDGAVEVLDAVRSREVRDHLNGCVACRDRLAVAAAVRDRATDLLRDDDPLEDLTLPTLVELEARAGRGGSPGPDSDPEGGPSEGGAGGAGRPGGGASRRNPVLAWAATVVLSLGVGYGVGVLGPEGLRPGAVLRPAPARTAAQGSETPGSLEDAATERSGAEGPVEGAAAPSAPRTDAAPDAPTDAARARVGETLEEEARSPEAAPPAEAPSAQALERLRQVPERERGEVIPLAVRGVEPGDAVARAATVGEGAGAGADAVLPRVVIGAAEARRTGLWSDSSRRAELQTSPLFRNAAVADPRLPSSAAAPTASVEADRGMQDGARADEGRGEPTSGPVGLALPGSTIDEVRWTEVWPGQEGVVVRQRLADGPLLELRVAGAAVGAADGVRRPPEDTAVETWSRAVREVEGGWMVLDGPLPAERLAELLAALR